MKKILSALLVLLFVAGIFSVPGIVPHAAAGSTVAVSASSTSYYTYDSSTSTLTLKNGFNANKVPTARGVYAPLIYSSGDLTINVQGTCYIMIQGDGLSSSVDYATGILCLGNLTITGTGTLNIMCATASYTNRYIAGIAALEAINSNINGGQNTLTVSGGVTVNVTPSGTNATRIYGVIADPDVYDGTLNVQTGTAIESSYPIFSKTSCVRNSKSALTAKAGQATVSGGASYAVKGFLRYYGGTVELMAYNYVMSDAPLFQNDCLPHKSYVNTSMLASTNLWNGSTQWNSYRYAKIVTVTEVLSGPYSITVSKPMAHYTVSKDITVSSGNPSKYTAENVTWNTSVFYFGDSSYFYVTIVPKDGYKLTADSNAKLTVNNLGVPYTASVASYGSTQIRFKVNFTIPDTRTVIPGLSITGFTMYRPKVGDEPLRNRYMGFTQYSEQKLTSWLVYDPDTDKWTLTFDPFEAGKTYKANIEYKITDTANPNGHTLAKNPYFKVDGYDWNLSGYVNQYSTYTVWNFESPSFTLNDDGTHDLVLKSIQQTKRSKYKVTVFDRNNDDEYSMSKTVDAGNAAALTFSELPTYGSMNLKVAVEKTDPTNTALKYRTRVTYIAHSAIDYTYNLPEPYLSGDSDMDGDVDVTDYSNAVNLALSSTGSIFSSDMAYDSTYKQYLCDYDEDGVVDALDCAKIEYLANH